MEAGVDRKALAERNCKGIEKRRVFTPSYEVRDGNDGTRVISGYASTTGVPYDMGWYTESISRGAFTKTLTESPEVRLLLNHEGFALASTQSGTLALREDNTGLHFEARVYADDPDVQYIGGKIARGLADQCSFAFRVTRQAWDEDYENREIQEVSLHRGDVSVVGIGANPSTPVSIRSFFEDLTTLDEQALEEIREDPMVLTVLKRLSPTKTFSATDLSTALAEIRAGAALSSTAVATLKHVLSLASTADNAVDEAQAVLADFLGVPNPDTDQDATTGGSGDQQNAFSLDYYRARAHAHRIRR